MQLFPVAHPMPLSRGNPHPFPTRIARSTPANFQPCWKHVDPCLHLSVFAGVYGHMRARVASLQADKAKQLQLILQQERAETPSFDIFKQCVAWPSLYSSRDRPDPAPPSEKPHRHNGVPEQLEPLDTQAQGADTPWCLHLQPETRQSARFQVSLWGKSMGIGM